ncbi:sensor histidine kinase [Archangium lipolyticum]|uniref:sensor histidine kinase n=1 Tax=Archangium lipolyticum TaxID=2970465 RepID=UPI00214A7B04|nr:ATP-binding protein [Archangium lipolyticum]
MRSSILSGVRTSTGRRALLFAAVLPPLTLLDVFALPSLSLGAFLTRVAWGLGLVVFTLLFERGSETQRRLLLLCNGAIGSLFYLALVYFTGELASPYVLLVPTLPLLAAFVYPEESGSAVASGVACTLAIVAYMWMGKGSVEQAAGWAGMVGTATFFGLVGSGQFRKTAAALNEVRVERARREALEKLAMAELQRAQSERLATVGRLAASVMHEINNPLAFVRANLHFIQGEVFTQPLAPGLRQELEEAFSETHSGMERIQQIILDLKGFSHSMDAEEARECSLAEVVEDAARLASIRLKSVGELKVEVPSALPKVFITPRRLAQVLLNLLVNAGDSLEDARVPRGEIRVHGEVRGQRVVLVVEDNGPGFPPEVLPRLFEAFFTTKGPEKGTGLGLSISRELVERFGGSLVAENRQEGGARLRIELPIYAPPAG